MRAAWHWGGDGRVMNDPLKAPGSTPLYSCLPPMSGSVSGDCYFPITHRMHKEKSFNKNPPLNEVTLLYRDTLSAMLNRGLTILAHHPKELVFLANIRRLSTE